MDFKSLFEISINIFDAMLAVIFFARFNRHKLKEKPVLFILFVFLFTIEIVNSKDFDVFAVILSIFISFIFQILIFGKSRWAKLLISCLLYFSSLIFLNSIVLNIVKLLINCSITEIIQRFELYAAVCLISKSCLFFLIKYYLHLEEPSNNKFKKNKSIFFLFFLTVYNIVIFIIYMFSSLDRTLMNQSVIIVFGMIGIFLSEIAHYGLYFLLNRKAEIELELEMLKQQKNYDEKIYDEKQVQAEKTARLKHDINGHLTYIAYQIEKGSNDAALNYIKHICNLVDVGMNCIVITNDTINYMINFKIDIAQRKGISFDCRIEDIKNCNMEAFDLCVMLNNILDNALEAVADSKEKKISVQIYCYLGYHVFSVKNSIERSVLYQNKKLTSSKKDKINHGYGLKQIETVAEKYQGYIDIYEAKNNFCMNVFIPQEQ